MSGKAAAECGQCAVDPAIGPFRCRAWCGLRDFHRSDCPYAGVCHECGVLLTHPTAAFCKPCWLHLTGEAQ